MGFSELIKKRVDLFIFTFVCVCEVYKKVKGLNHRTGENIFKMENANELITRIYKELLKSRRTIQINAKMGLKPE